MATGFGGNLAGGTHHAFFGEGAGFCVFNDLAIAIRAVGRRAAVIDLDVHQGDGTAAIFEGDDSVLTVSVHAENNFPFHKRRSSIDIALPDGAEDADYLERLRGILPAVAGFRPEIVFYQAGVDGLATDRLGRLRLTQEGLEARDRTIFEFVRKLGSPVVVTLGGGYSDPLDETVVAHSNTFRSAWAVLQPFQPWERLLK
jgi:acetoin utilization deacetylase AcuC-like enzyme